ncbi:MAG: hypothetical protein LBS53_01270 [Synergistaceae bacterium]|nr:hypothetical protein [Synergistaceae bacterium]
MEEALQIRRQMVESDPDNNVLWQALADAMLAGYTLKYLQKDIEAAAALAASAYEITSKFVRLYPENESYALKHRIAGDSVEKCKRGLEKQ